MRYVSAGESHGEKITVIVEDVPQGITLNEKAIEFELKRRSVGIGRSSRQNIESNKCKITAGVNAGKTTGSPVCIEIPNFVRDYPSEEDNFPRPGTADLAGVLKYSFSNCHNVVERASARETAARVAAGVIAKEFLANFDVEVSSYVTKIGNVEVDSAGVNHEINEAKKSGNTLGGICNIVCVGLVPGIGSYQEANLRLNSKLFYAVSSIPSVRSVSLLAGIDGGLTNGENLLLEIVCKPVPTTKHAAKTINLSTGDIVEHASTRRSDTCVVPNVAVIAESETAIVLTNAYMDKFGRDALNEIKYAYLGYKTRISKL